MIAYLPWVLGPTGLLVLGSYLLYEYSLHPAWRRERQLIRACRMAFDEGDYRLLRVRLQPGGPSGADFFSSPFGESELPRYFTYRIETEEGVEPDFGGMRREEIGRIRHYLNRDVSPAPHHGREVIRPK